MITKTCAVNSAPLTPISFLLRAGRFFAGRPAIIYGNQQMTYGQLKCRVGRLARALKDRGVRAGDCVAVMAPNIPQTLEAHYAIPLIGAAIIPLNLKLDASTIGSCLQHANCRLAICDRQYLTTMNEATAVARVDIPIVVINDNGVDSQFVREDTDYEDFIANAGGCDDDPEIEEETQLLSLLYTSGTTANPKAVSYVHRGAYLAAVSNAMSFNLDHNSVYLWTWPMFHSHGLSFVWAVTAVGGTHVCLREVDVPAVCDLIKLHRVSHFCVVPTVMNTLAAYLAESNAIPEASQPSAHRAPVKCIVGGAAPAATAISQLEKAGIEVIHQYGSTECYGPVTVCWRRHTWEEMSIEERYSLTSKQGTPAPAVDDLRVAKIDSVDPVPMDGNTTGEVLVRGNTVMQGYFADEEATRSAMSDDWYRTGDIATWHPDGTIEIKDRSADLIVSAGKRISSVEIDDVLHEHPAVLDAAVVAKPDVDCGEVPYAFVSLQPGRSAGRPELEDFCRARLADYMIPRGFEFCELPKTATGKIKKSELRKLAARL